MKQELIDKFSANYGLSSTAELFSIKFEDIMENILGITEQLDRLDTSDIDRAIELIGYLEEWKALYLYISEPYMG